jgi:hypothetical protein
VDEKEKDEASADPDLAKGECQSSQWNWFHAVCFRFQSICCVIMVVF